MRARLARRARELPPTIPTCALLLLALLLVASACGGSDAQGEAAIPTGLPTVLATTTVLGDIATNAACNRATVTTLMSPGQDPHAFELSARQAADLGDADLVIANGLGLEQGFADVLLEARDAGTPVLFVAEHVDPLPYRGAADQGENHEGESHMLDPHVWLDPLRMAEGTRLIGAELARVADDDSVAGCAEEYAAMLESLDAEVARSLDTVPDASRKLVANHQALGYFADRYGFELVGVVIPGGSTLAEPSASELVDLVETIERENVPAIFAETTTSGKLAEAVAEETGREVEIVRLYTGSLGEPESGAETYSELIATNAERIRAALAP